MTVRLVELKHAPHGAASDVATIAVTCAGIVVRSLLFLMLLIIVVVGAMLGLAAEGGAAIWKRTKP